MFNNNSWQSQQLALILQSQYQINELQYLQQQQQHQQLQPGLHQILPDLQQQQYGMHYNNGDTNDIVNLDDVDDCSEDDDSDDKRTIFLANLDEQITEELLYEVFLQAGPLESVRIPTDSNGKKRSFGFVTYLHQCSVPYALQLFGGLTLFRKPITMNPQTSSGGNHGTKQRRSLETDMSLKMGNGTYINPFNMLPQGNMLPNYTDETSRYVRDRNLQRDRPRERTRDRRDNNHGNKRNHAHQEYQTAMNRRSDQRRHPNKRR